MYIQCDFDCPRMNLIKYLKITLKFFEPDGKGWVHMMALIRKKKKYRVVGVQVR